jgi:hypothetical protein
MGSISPAAAREERISDISHEVFNCLKNNNVNDEGYVTYGDNGDMWVGRGRPGTPGGVKMRYSYNPDQKVITLQGGSGDLLNVLGRTRDGINRTADKCRKGELH